MFFFMKLSGNGYFKDTKGQSKSSLNETDIVASRTYLYNRRNIYLKQNNNQDSISTVSKTMRIYKHSVLSLHILIYYNYYV